MQGSSAVASSFFSVLVGKLGVQPPRPVRRPMAMLPPPLPEDLQDDAADESPIDTYSPLIAMINSEMYTTALEALMCLANLAETPASLAGVYPRDLSTHCVCSLAP